MLNHHTFYSELLLNDYTFYGELLLIDYTFYGELLLHVHTFYGELLLDCGCGIKKRAVIPIANTFIARSSICI